MQTCRHADSGQRNLAIHKQYVYLTIESYIMLASVKMQTNKAIVNATNSREVIDTILHCINYIVLRHLSAV